MSIAMAHGMRKRMAKGGMCSAHGEQACPMCHGGKMAEGGEVASMADERDEYDPTQEPMPKENMAADEESDDLVDAIMRQRAKMLMMSEGGKVANQDQDDLTDFKSNSFDDLANRDDLEEHYTGANSGDEIGNATHDEEDDDLVAAIMRSRAKRDRMPRPA